MTHSELVDRAAKWLRSSMRCPVVLTEFASGAGEQPDAIGWKYMGLSYMVEAKASRADFLRDKKKMYRHPALQCDCLGLYRYYISIPGVVQPDELPPCWGLLEVVKNRIRVKVQASPSEQTTSGVRREVCMLMSALRRPLYKRDEPLRTRVILS